MTREEFTLPGNRLRAPVHIRLTPIEGKDAYVVEDRVSVTASRVLGLVKRVGYGRWQPYDTGDHPIGTQTINAEAAAARLARLFPREPEG